MIWKIKHGYIIRYVKNNKMRVPPNWPILKGTRPMSLAPVFNNPLLKWKRKIIPQYISSLRIPGIALENPQFQKMKRRKILEAISLTRRQQWLAGYHCHALPFGSILYCISESRRSLDDHFSTVCFLIASPEIKAQHGNNDKEKELTATVMERQFKLVE